MATHSTIVGAIVNPISSLSGGFLKFWEVLHSLVIFLIALFSSILFFHSSPTELISFINLFYVKWVNCLRNLVALSLVNLQFWAVKVTFCFVLIISLIERLKFVIGTTQCPYFVTIRLTDSPNAVMVSIPKFNCMLCVSWHLLR